jgi:hypothetical protein
MLMICALCIKFYDKNSYKDVSLALSESQDSNLNTMHAARLFFSKKNQQMICSPTLPCLFGLISRISSHPAVFFSHNKSANSAFSTINQRNEQAVVTINSFLNHIVKNCDYLP